MIIFDHIMMSRMEEKILFYNLSGKCELRIRKKNIKNKTYDECVSYVRRKLFDLSITAIKNFNAEILFNDMEYNIIIRNNHRESIWRYYTGVYYMESRYNLDILLWELDLVLWGINILFDDKEFILLILNNDNIYSKNMYGKDISRDYRLYNILSERLKCDQDICRAVIKPNPSYFENLHDNIKTNIDFILSLKNDIIYKIYDDLPDNIKNNIEICIIVTEYMPSICAVLPDEIKNNMQYYRMKYKK